MPVLLLILLILSLVVFIRWGIAWGITWGATDHERSMPLPGDALFGETRKPFLSMTRAISIQASPELVWKWMAQMGRGGGWYSYDWIDNAGKASARHLISWIPAPQIGDTCPIGRLARFEENRLLTWWADSVRIPGGQLRCAFDIQTIPEVENCRLVVRISADATGLLARPLLTAFSIGDSIMARKQLLVVKQSIELYGDRTENPDQPETGARDQYQWMANMYSSGETAGKVGIKLSEKWRQSAESLPEE